MKIKIAKTSPKIEPMPGTVVAQMVRCGRRNCRCAHGELHGPYHCHYWYEEGRRYKTYLRKDQVAKVQAACEANRNLRCEIRELNEMSRQEWRRMKAALKELGL